MIELLYVVLGLFFVVGLIWLKPSFFQVSKSAVGTLNGILSNEEEAEKLSRLETSTKRLLIDLAKVLLGMAAVGLALVGVVFLSSQVIGIGFSELNIWSLKFLLFFSLGTLPVIIWFKRSNSSYSATSKLLHELILPNYFVHKKLAKFLDRFSKKTRLEPRSDFLVITGLARSGTTALLNALHEHGGFSSLTYNDMPMLLSSHSWKRINKSKTLKKTERSHKDGIMINVDSPEAFDEYFFKSELNDSYILEEALLEHKLPEDFWENYLAFHSGIRSSSEQVYLTKNNNFLLHYAAALKSSTDFQVVIMIRDPLTHCHSLLEKHQQYSESNKDEFEKNYMNWIGHYEFGLNHKPFKFNKAKYALENTDPLHIDYWLKNWINYYSQVERFLDHATLISYAEFCTNPNEIQKGILSRFGLELNAKLKPHASSRKNESSNGTNGLLKEAQKLHRYLTETYCVKV